MGLIELSTFVEDIGAIPVLAVYAGYSLDGKAVPQDKLQPYIDEVIKELDFLTASANKKSMGALRERLGRSQPFDIKYVEIDNEDFFLLQVHTAFYNALSKRYPTITCIATTTRYISTPPAVDDHDYQVPLFFIQNFRRYKNILRPSPKALVGEFSVINVEVDRVLISDLVKIKKKYFLIDVYYAVAKTSAFTPVPSYCPRIDLFDKINLLMMINISKYSILPDSLRFQPS